MASKEQPLAQTSQEQTGIEIKTKIPRVFDWTKYNKRYVALQLAYLGEDYCGFAIQEPPQATIESCLFEVLQRTRLVEDIHSCKYSRCGRTDKGVSALGQVVALQVRSNLLEGAGVIVAEDSQAHLRRHANTTTELPYMVMLNKNLPDEVRVLGWCDVPSDFSARFSCQDRTYKYFFPRGDMDLDAMRAAAKHLIGCHDFRNFCYMDINGGVTNFRRTILKFDIDILDTGSAASPYQLCEATVVGQAFLMHQVRCMMALLFLVGNGLEQPSLVDHMLDLQRCPRKPQYGMAPPEPLVLCHCRFPGLEWQREGNSGRELVAHFQKLWTRQATKAAMIQRVAQYLSSSLTPDDTPTSHVAPLVARDHRLGKSYRPILERPTANTFEERYEHHLTKKRKLGEDNSEEKT